MNVVNRRVLVIGATGSLGPTIVHYLCQCGYSSVSAFCRNVPAAGIFPNNVNVLFGDIADPSSVYSALADIDVVIHLAALLHIVNSPPNMIGNYESINVGGTANVIDAAIRAGVKRVVFASTIAVYGPSGNHVLNEESITCPDSLYGQTKLTAEQIVLNARRADGQPLGTVVRLGAVYGARIKGNYQRLVHALAHGRFVPIGDGSNRRTLVYDKDVASAALLALQHPAAAGRVYNVTDGQFHTVREINLAICTALGRKPPSVFVPTGPARLAAGLLEDAAHLLGRRSPVGRATIDKYTEDVAVDGQRIQRELGFQPAYDLYAGWQDAVDEMRRRGEL
jgi:nucleoside-diphosphate-sugar epimerase